jgi:alkylation response protein AidB-like acyl-CoA dehydrogenase
MDNLANIGNWMRRTQVYEVLSAQSDFLTPLLKLFSSEYWNQIAYDALQIHGAPLYEGFSDRTHLQGCAYHTIYEGTSQLQVVQPFVA